MRWLIVGTNDQRNYESFYTSLFTSRWMLHASAEVHLLWSLQGEYSIAVQHRIQRKSNSQFWSGKNGFFILCDIWNIGTKISKNKLKSGYQVLRASETFSYIVWQFIAFFTVSVISEQFHCSATSGKLWWSWKSEYTFWKLQRVSGGRITSHSLALGRIILKARHDIVHHFFPAQLCSKIPFSIFTATILHVGDFLIPKADACTTFPKAPCPSDFPVKKINYRDILLKKKSCRLIN